MSDAVALRARVLVGDIVYAEAVIADDRPKSHLEQISAEHEAIARRLLIQGMTVTLECRNLDGSPYSKLVLTPDDSPEGFHVVELVEYES